MPFVAEFDGEKVIPEGVEDGTTVQCVECREGMHPWGPSENGTARHFKHYSRDRDCDAVRGESDLHRKMKSLAVSRLRNLFPDNLSCCGPEISLDAPVTDAKDYRQADALVEFVDPDQQLGNGLIVEVQYRNKSKDIESTTDDYLAQNYSIVWAYEDDFDNDSFLLDEDDLRERARNAVWPHRAKRPSEWRREPHGYDAIQSRWREAWEPGLSESGASATLPPDWCDQTAREIWRDQDWGSLFPFDGDRDSDEYQSETFLDQVCDDPELALEINLFPILPETRIRDWYNDGLLTRDDAHETVPRPSEWPGHEEPEHEYSPPSIPVRMPPEFVEKHRDELELRWQYGAGELDLDVVRELSENNAPRNCSECESDADYYLLKSGILSEYRCADHMDVAQPSSVDD